MTDTFRTDMPADEVLDTLTGFDELAIEKYMGIDVYTDGESKPMLFMRALVFVLRRRDGDVKDSEAYQFAMGMTVKELNSTFPESEPADDEAPAGTVGKGEPLTSDVPETSPVSASQPG